MVGSLSWQQKIELRFSNGFQFTDISSEIRVINDEVNYLIGNGHTFFLPHATQEVVAEEYVIKDGEDDPLLIGVYTESSVEIVKRENPDQLLVYPKTKFLQDVKQIKIILGYKSPISYPPTDTQFEIHVDLTVYLKEYLERIECLNGEEALNRLILKMYPPEGCRWDTDKNSLLMQFDKLRGLAIDQDSINADHNEVIINFSPGQPSRRSEKISLSLPVTRSIEEAQHALDQLNARHTAITTESCVVFVCDLCGSSDQTVDGRPPADLLRFRKIWSREGVEPFRMIKVTGDMALVVCAPDLFRQQGLTEILGLYMQTLKLGVRLRGGFHFDKALATGDSNKRMIGHRIGMEFLGDAINRGAKIGDFKENKSGLLASAEFMNWFYKTELFPSPWKTETFGNWKTNLYRIDIGNLCHSANSSNIKPEQQTEQHFADRLLKRAQNTASHLIVGLDPDVERFPKFLRDSFAADPSDRTLEEVIFQFNKAVIDAACLHAAAFKPQAAFYEQYGYAGIAALQQTIAYLRKLDLPIILDAKRNDVEHTASAYGKAWLGCSRPLTGEINNWRVDAITVNGYLGIDGIKPFLDVDPHAGLFVLAKTSNPSSGEFQDLRLQESGEMNFERMAILTESWGHNTIGEKGYSRIGLVVGATYPEASARLRQLAPSALFLMPGVGAQGAGFEAVAMGCDTNGAGAFAASSRSVLYGFNVEDASGKNTWRSAVMTASEQEAKRIKNGVQATINGR